MKVSVAFPIIVFLVFASGLHAQYSVKVDPQFLNCGSHLRPDSVYTSFVKITSDQDQVTYVRMGQGGFGDTAQQEYWCSFDPLNFRLDPRDSMTVTLHVRLSDSSGRKFRQYFPVHTYADGSTQDPSFRVIQIMAQSINVRPRHLVILPDSVDFGVVRMGQSVQRTFTFYSPDSASIIFDREPPGYEYFALDNYPLDPITDSVTVTVRFSPLGYGERVTYMAVAGNTDPEQRMIALRGHVDSVSLVVRPTSSSPAIRFIPDDALSLSLTEPSHIEIYDLLGRQLYAADVATGEHTLQLTQLPKLVFAVVRTRTTTVYKLIR